MTKSKWKKFHWQKILSQAIFTVLSTFLISSASYAKKTFSVEELFSMDLVELMEIPVFSLATGVEQSTLHAPAAATVISAADIKAIGARQLGDVLIAVPGLHVSVNGFHEDIYAIRGLGSPENVEVLMMINGVPINTLFTGGHSYVWAGMPVNGIARIEVIRGPGSAVHGADAYAGVINIITKTLDDIERNEIGIYGGSFDSGGTWLNAGTNWNGWKLAANLEYSETDGPDVVVEKDLQSILDDVMGTDASYAPGKISAGREQFDMHLNAQQGVWELRGMYQGRRDVGRAIGDANALDPNARFKDDRYQFDIEYHDKKFTEHWEVKAIVNHQRMDFDTSEDQVLFPPGSKVFCDAPSDADCNYDSGVIGNLAVKENHWRADITAFYKGFDKHLLRFGTGYHLAEITEVRAWVNFLGFDPKNGETFAPGSRVVDISDTQFAITKEGDRKNYYAFLQDTWRFNDNLEFTAGLRYDDYPDFDSTLTPRLSAVWKATDKATLKLLYGEAFRSPPSFAELYNNTNVDEWAVGNPGLQLETMETWEVSAGYQFNANLRSDITAYKYQRHNVIAFTDKTFANIGEIHGYGGEWEVHWKPTRHVNVYGNYAYQHIDDKNLEYIIHTLPEHQAYIRLNWEFQDNWHLNVQEKWIGSRKRITIDSRSKLKGYNITNMALRHINKNWEFSLSAHNLFDNDAREPSGVEPNGLAGIPNDVPLEGRSWFVELRYHF